MSSQTFRSPISSRMRVAGKYADTSTGRSTRRRPAGSWRREQHASIHCARHGDLDCPERVELRLVDFDERFPPGGLVRARPSQAHFSGSNSARRPKPPDPIPTRARLARMVVRNSRLDFPCSLFVRKPVSWLAFAFIGTAASFTGGLACLLIAVFRS